MNHVAQLNSLSFHVLFLVFVCFLVLGPSTQPHPQTLSSTFIQILSLTKLNSCPTSPIGYHLTTPTCTLALVDITPSNTHFNTPSFEEVHSLLLEHLDTMPFCSASSRCTFPRLFVCRLLQQLVNLAMVFYKPSCLHENLDLQFVF